MIVREVGFGLPGKLVRELRDLGVAAFDTGGSGGTSWAKVEGLVSDDPRRQRAGEVFRDWGISTTESLEEIARETVDPGIVLATGGIRTGIDLAKALALGAHACGLAAPFLRSYQQGGQLAVAELVRQLNFELRVAMFGCGVATIQELRQKDGVLSRC